MEVRNRRQSLLELDSGMRKLVTGYGAIGAQVPHELVWTCTAPFRPSGFLVWEPVLMRLESLLLGGEQQVLRALDLGEERFRCSNTATEFLSQVARLSPGPMVTQLEGQKLHCRLDVAELPFRTVEVGQRISLRWSGACSGVLLIGRAIEQLDRERHPRW